MKRRAFIALLAGTASTPLVSPLAARAQQPAKLHRIGFLGNSSAPLEANLTGPFREGLRDLGYVEGRNFVIEYRWADGKYERFPSLIAELIALNVDVIVTAGMEFAIEHRLPGVHAYRELVEAGGLMSYGPSYADMHRRAASYVDKILKGPKPAELPIEQPAKFELVINMKTAKAYGIAIPQSVFARADRVID